ncbi:pyridine nucleotide-disulfide oxidoreductase [Fusarium albosuccineum]|uniref:Pyridine nucleotide-disulfide oxidoreductase n=1 Tax=Fusarium albosuccineum TaxID=1237068 RepID=A0A8H4P3G5_9HYPO|nr:pyridine nucleotide-disulfide oxidoreductase [Fusarium albosuccineum]
MWFKAAALFPFVFLLASAAPTGVSQKSVWPQYDAIVVGGGPAGLSALSALARVRRKALLIDSNEYRNAPTRHMHDVVGFDGVTPAYFRWAARQKLEHYETVSAKNGTVIDIQPRQNNTYFEVSVEETGATYTYTARKIILATGMRDIIPNTEGLRENFGKGIFWCPWCDGMEHADQRVGILASSFANAVESLAGLSTLNTGITILADGKDTEKNRKEADQKVGNATAYLELRRVTVENRTIKAIERLKDGHNPNQDPSLPTAPEHDLFRIHFEGEKKEYVDRDALFVSFGAQQRSRIHELLQLKMGEENKIWVNQTTLETNMTGVYAVGDANNGGSTNVPHALFSGKRAGVKIHYKLEREDRELVIPPYSTPSTSSPASTSTSASSSSSASASALPLPSHPSSPPSKEEKVESKDDSGEQDEFEDEDDIWAQIKDDLLEDEQHRLYL